MRAEPQRTRRLVAAVFDRIDRIIRIRGRGMFSILSILLILSKKTLRPLRLCVRKTAALESGLCYNMPRLPDG